MTSFPQQVIGDTTDDCSTCQEESSQLHGSMPTWKRWGTEPSVKPERVTQRELQGSSLSPCPRAHPLTTTDTLPQSSPSANEISAANNSHLVV